MPLARIQASVIIAIVSKKDSSAVPCVVRETVDASRLHLLTGSLPSALERKPPSEWKRESAESGAHFKVQVLT